MSEGEREREGERGGEWRDEGREKEGEEKRGRERKRDGRRGERGKLYGESCKFLSETKSRILRTFHFDIVELWVDAEGQVARQGPRGRRPGDHTNTGVLVQGEIHNDYRGKRERKEWLGAGERGETNA